MTLYEFEVISPKEHEGEVVEIEIPMANAPSFGEERTLDDGRVCKRILSARSFHRVPQWDCAHVALQLAKGHPDAPHYTKDGKPAFQSMREIREFGAKWGYRYNPD